MDITYAEAQDIAAFMKTYEQFQNTLSQCLAYGYNLNQIIQTLQQLNLFATLLSEEQQINIALCAQACQNAITLIQSVLHPSTDPSGCP